MKVVVVAPPAIRIPVRNYGGIEVAGQWHAAELARRGHEVTLMGNLDDGPSPAGWTGVRILTEADPLTPDKYPILWDADVVHDFTHMKVARLARTKRYVSTTMYSDRQSGRDVYPSEAVREAFKDPSAPVVPLGVPVDGITPRPATPGRYVCLGRVASYKGQDLAIEVARKANVPLTVAGHTGAYAEAYFALAIRRQCADAGFGFVADPPNLDALLDGAAGLLHLHRWIESFSIVAAQALLRGVPILTTDVGAVQEWVRATDGGMVVSLKDLLQGRLEAAGTDGFFETNWSSRRAGIAKRAREIFDVRRTAAAYERIYAGGRP